MAVTAWSWFQLALQLCYSVLPKHLSPYFCFTPALSSLDICSSLATVPSLADYFMHITFDLSLIDASVVACTRTYIRTSRLRENTNSRHRYIIIKSLYTDLYKFACCNFNVWRLFLATFLMMESIVTLMSHMND